MVRIRSVQPLDGYRVRMVLSDGATDERSLRGLVWGPAFQPLLDDYSRFRSVSVVAGTLTWPGDLDFGPDVLIWGGPAPTDPGARPAAFLELESRGPDRAWGSDPADGTAVQSPRPAFASSPANR